LVEDGLGPENRTVKLITGKACVLWNGGVGRALRQTAPSSEGPSGPGSIADPTALIAAAHAASFSTALLKELGLKAQDNGEMSTTATVTVEHSSAGATVTNINLHVVAKLPKITQSKFIDATLRAKTGCLVSRLLRANISMNAKLATN
jgi:lipoyl-dependent peroxiredoxin